MYIKKGLFVVLLGLGLISLSACTTSQNSMPEFDDQNQSESMVELEDDMEQVVNNSVVLADASYQLDLDASTMTWYGEKAVGKSHLGTVDLQSGNLEIKDGQLVGGEFIIDMNSLKNDEEIASLDKHLKSADFFDVVNYPEAKLVITDSNSTDEPNIYQITADLTIKDITAPISFEAQIKQEANILSALSEIEIDRTTWNLQYGSGKFFQDLGDNMINDELMFKLDLQFKQ